MPRQIDQIESLDPNDPTEAQEAIDSAVMLAKDLDVTNRQDAQARASSRTSRSPNAIKLARRP